jgi:hypothetical protein
MFAYQGFAFAANPAAANARPTLPSLRPTNHATPVPTGGDSGARPFPALILKVASRIQIWEATGYSPFCYNCRF